jgi:hypothetical protein
MVDSGGEAKLPRPLQVVFQRVVSLYEGMTLTSRRLVERLAPWWQVDVSGFHRVVSPFKGLTLTSRRLAERLAPWRQVDVSSF